MRTEPKASYRTVQYEYAYRYTPSMYVYIYICVSAMQVFINVTFFTVICNKSL